MIIPIGMAIVTNTENTATGLVIKFNIDQKWDLTWSNGNRVCHEERRKECEHFEVPGVFSSSLVSFKTGFMSSFTSTEMVCSEDAGLVAGTLSFIEANSI